MDLNIREKIVQHIQSELGSKIEELRSAIEVARESRDNETKSSVGDKYETGRAMVQMELEKTQAQLAKTESLLTTLQKIDLQNPSTKIGFGSFVVSDSGNYFFSIAFGELKINNISVFCLSPLSPIGKVLAGKTAGEKVDFQNRSIQIKDVF